MKVCVTFSRGGHFQEAMNACQFLIGDTTREVFFLTYKPVNKEPKSRVKTCYVTHPEHGKIVRRFFLFMINFFQSFKVFLNERPDVVVSTGADVTLSIMLIAKMFRKKVIFIESGANVTQPSLTGKIIYPFADLFVVQWEELKHSYPKAICGGPLL
jgi:beta-1,4-N-acetylglucosaminyltransferase